MNLIPSIDQQPGASLRRAVLGWLMRIANRHPLHRWYENKAILLDHYGEPDGFDLQTVEATCWSCGGEGCDDCDYDGIHHTTRTVLIRRHVGACMFHTPSRRWYVEDLPRLEKDPAFRRHIRHRIQHRPCDPRASREALGAILLLTGHYRQWWIALTAGGPYITNTIHFGAYEPGFYPQHLLAAALYSVRQRWINFTSDKHIPF